MAGSLNRVSLIGNVGKDPEIRSMQTGARIANLTIATSESWKDKESGENKEKTEWHRVVCFNDGLVGVIEKYVKKGSKLFVEGKLQTRKWTDQSGQERYSTEVVIAAFGGQLILLTPQSGGSRGPQSEDDYRQPATTGGAQRAARSPESVKRSPGPEWDTPKDGDLDDEIPF